MAFFEQSQKMERVLNIRCLTASKRLEKVVDIFRYVIRFTVYITDNGAPRWDFTGKKSLMGRFVDLGEGIDSSRAWIRRRGQVGTLLGGDET